jgi:hypothetical protein
MGLAPLVTWAHVQISQGVIDMKNMAKTPRTGIAPAVRQTKGPGMNLGLKKPRIGYIPKPKKYATPKDMKLGALAKTTSYLPTLAGGGKIISSKQS